MGNKHCQLIEKKMQCFLGIMFSDMWFILLEQVTYIQLGKPSDYIPWTCHATYIYLVHPQPTSYFVFLATAVSCLDPEYTCLANMILTVPVILVGHVIRLGGHVTFQLCYIPRHVYPVMYRRLALCPVEQTTLLFPVYFSCNCSGVIQYRTICWRIRLTTK